MISIQRFRDAGLGLVAGILVLATVSGTRAQSTMPIYSDSLLNGWEDWSWAEVNLTDTSQVHSGSASIRVIADSWEAFSVHHNEMDMNLYSSLSFWAHGGSGGGQRLQVYANYGTTSAPADLLPALAANTWQQFEIPLADLGVATVTDLDRFSIQLSGGGAAGPFYVDDIELTDTSSLLGDYNGNGVVDAADYTVWRDHLGNATSLVNDDTPGIGPDDYVRWKMHFGEVLGGSGSGSGAAGYPLDTSAEPLSAVVPEPATNALLMLAMIAILCRRDVAVS